MLKRLFKLNKRFRMIASAKDAELEKFSLEAKKEIGEDGANIGKVLANLKDILEENYKTLRLPPEEDEFLLRFLRASKFDVPRTAKQVSKYFDLINQMRDMHHLMNPASVSYIFEDIGIVPLIQRDSKGRVVILLRQEKLGGIPGWIEIVIASFLLMADFVQRICEDTQRIGIVCVVDLKSHSFSHIRHLNPSRLIQATKLVCGAFPGRIKAIHLVRNPEIFNLFFAIVKPFLGQKMRSRIFLHGHNLKAFHSHVEPEILPEYLGGKKAEGKYADMEVVSSLLAENEYYKDWIKYGYNQGTREDA